MIGNTLGRRFRSNVVEVVVVVIVVVGLKELEHGSTILIFMIVISVFEYCDFILFVWNEECFYFANHCSSVSALFSCDLRRICV